MVALFRPESLNRSGPVQEANISMNLLLLFLKPG